MILGVPQQAIDFEYKISSFVNVSQLNANTLISIDEH